jgi:hypothetical protein
MWVEVRVRERRKIIGSVSKVKYEGKQRKRNR